MGRWTTTGGNGRLRRGVLLASAVMSMTAVCSGLLSAQETTPGEPPRSAEQQVLEGVDLSLPSQEAFRQWPPEGLRRRLYWLPWSAASFQRARLFDRPVFFLLTVPWSRAAQRLDAVTLADPQVAEYLNAAYLTIRVDGDLRPDLRERYQVSGAWPAALFLLPDGHPMISEANPEGVAQPITLGYVSPERMRFLLGEGREYFERRRQALPALARLWVERDWTRSPEPGRLSEDASDEIARWLMANADRADGGFGAAPKYPIPWLAEYGALRDARLLPALLAHARFTYSRLAASPLYDAVEGGFHRIATTPGWGKIQYEKLLDRNAAVVRDLALLARQEADPELRDVLARTSRFVMERLGRPGGGFYLAQVADPQSEDGGGYWKAAERDPRRAPPLDRLVLSGPGAMAAAALSRAGRVLDDEALVRRGVQDMDWILAQGWVRGRGMEHALEPVRLQEILLKPQAEVAFACLDLYETTGLPRFLEAARDLADSAWRNLKFADDPALRDRLPKSDDVGLLRYARYPMDDNALMARVYRRLQLHQASADAGSRARELVEAFLGDPVRYRVSGIPLAVAVEEVVRDPLVVEIAAGAANAEALRAAAVRSPWGWVLVRTVEATGGAPARVRWRDETREIRDARALPAAVRELTGP